jgi:HAD superfamily hydrolase (TIGR01509 family)
MIRLALFDLDGTLLKSTEIIMDTFVITFKKFFKEIILDQKTLTSFLGHTLFETFGMYIREDQDMDTLVGFYRETSEILMKDVKAYPNAKEIMERLQSKGVHIGVVTSKMNHVAREHLTLIGLNAYVTHLVGYEDVKKHKPDKEPIEKALSLFDMTASEALYVGDHENDMIAAKAAGVISCAVSYSHRLKEMLAVMPDYVVDDLLQIEEMI